MKEVRSRLDLALNSFTSQDQEVEVLVKMEWGEREPRSSPRRVLKRKQLHSGARNTNWRTFSERTTSDEEEDSIPSSCSSFSPPFFLVLRSIQLNFATLLLAPFSDSVASKWEKSRIRSNLHRNGTGIWSGNVSLRSYSFYLSSDLRFFMWNNEASIHSTINHRPYGSLCPDKHCKYPQGEAICIQKNTQLPFAGSQ